MNARAVRPTETINRIVDYIASVHELLEPTDESIEDQILMIWGSEDSEISGKILAIALMLLVDIEIRRRLSAKTTGEFDPTKGEASATGHCKGFNFKTKTDKS